MNNKWEIDQPILNTHQDYQPASNPFNVLFQFNADDFYIHTSYPPASSWIPPSTRDSLYMRPTWLQNRKVENMKSFKLLLYLSFQFENEIT